MIATVIYKTPLRQRCSNYAGTPKPDRLKDPVVKAWGTAQRKPRPESNEP